MARVDVGSVAELPEGVPTPAKVAQREVVLVRWGDEVFALRNICPHQTQSFKGGRVLRPIESTGVPGEITLGDGAMLVCPWHVWKYDCRTGVCVDDPNFRIKTYDVVVENDRILVEVG